MKKYLIAFIIILIAVSLLEVFLFNFNHFRIKLGNYEEETHKIDQVALIYEGNSYFEIDDLDKKIATLNVELDESKLEKNAIEYEFEFSDETSEHYRRMPTKCYVKGNELTHYIPTYLSGNVSKIRLAVNKSHADCVESVTINKMIPFHFNMIRVTFLCLFIMAIYTIHTSTLFKQTFQSNSRMQQLVLYGALVVVLAFMMWLSRYCTCVPEDNLYNEVFVDSIMQGKLYLDVDLGEDFLKLKDPYDDIGRRVTHRGVDYRWDTAYYEGKVYEYFGVLPLLLIFLPYRLVTGKYLAIAPIVFLFSAGCLILLKELLEMVIKRYFKDIPFKIVFYLTLMLFFGSLIIYLNALGRIYELAVISGLFFTLLGMLLIFKSMNKEKKKYIYISCGCSCLALSVACRPTQLFASLVIVPYLLSLLISNIKNYKEKKAPLFKLIFGVGIPYMVVGIALMWYNYVRFGSPFDFGTKYQLTITNMFALKSRQYVIPMGLFTNLFTIPSFVPTFPYVVNQNNLPVFYGYYYIENIVAGAFFVAPISFFVFNIISVNKKMENKECKIIIDSLIIVALIIAIISVYMGGSNERYLIDYLWMLTFAGIMIFLFIYNFYESLEAKKISQKILCILTIYTVFLGTFSGILSERNYLCLRSPEVYFGLRYSINFWE